MNKEQIQANFKAAHKAAVASVADAQFTVMDAQAALASAREVQRSLEKQFRLDMAAATASPQGELFEKGTGKK